MTKSLKTKLAIRTIFGFIFLILLIGILLMLPAGTLDYWQGWGYLAVLTTVSGLITAYLWRKDPKLLERRVRAGPVAEKESSQKLIQVFASLAFLGLMILPTLDHRFGWSRVPSFIEIAGDAFVVLSYYLIWLVFKENSFSAATIEVAADQRVISTGPYAIVRHPMYASALIMIFGTPLALGSWWGLLMSVAMTLVIVWRLLDEEEFLARNLPGYEEYCRKVRYHLVPLIW
ncbi:MAG TPA: isoprenylcysteine carboxylmethyltransferase family protein [Candidatus Kapabacteria bacterium]|nr:isoprenylcysteine carboxylmethyltransferase family protein [Candidatus Kapabacteria bacterium]